MKELKRLSLKEEIDREAEQIEKEVKERTDLDDIKVSEEMETALFNKIQDYEYDKRTKTVYHRKKRRYFIVALAAVLVLVFGSAMTGIGSKSYWKVIWDRMAGEENASVVNVEDMDAQTTSDIDELQVYKEIRNELGISIVRLQYLPKRMVLKEYEIDKEQKRATLIYDWDGQVIRYMMYMNDTDSSFGQVETDELINEYSINTDNNVEINVKEYSIDNVDEKRNVAEFEYRDAQYQLMGIMPSEEFDKILKNLFFYE